MALNQTCAGTPAIDPAELLAVGELIFIEHSFAGLPDDRFTALMENIDADQARMLVDEESNLLALAVHISEDRWLAGCFHLRNPTSGIISRFEEIGGEIYQEDRSVWERSIRMRFSMDIQREVPPALEDLNPARIGMVRSLVEDVWKSGLDKTCLDFCCGSGLGSLILRDLGFRVLSCDIDMSLISLGLSKGRLLPEETMCFDAVAADRYLQKTDHGLGLMFGEINRFNTDLWEQITGQLIGLASRTLITAGKEDEAAMIAGWARDSGAAVEVFENDRDPIYDRWVCDISEPGLD